MEIHKQTGVGTFGQARELFRLTRLCSIIGPMSNAFEVVVLCSLAQPIKNLLCFNRLRGSSWFHCMQAV